MPVCERTCTAKNRVRELRSPGSVRDEGSNVLVYSDVVETEFADERKKGRPQTPFSRHWLCQSRSPATSINNYYHIINTF